jgi:predicted acetyltransferase
VNSHDHSTLPIDADAAAALAADGLRFELVDNTENGNFPVWLQTVTRGFFGERMSPEALVARQKTAHLRRNSGVWDDTAVDVDVPVATAASWPSDLTIPGHSTIPAWAITAITVSPTHRRRGIARAMLDAELRTARALGYPIAMLTVSESTIYSRWGFAPSAMAADWSIKTARAEWIGPRASGRVHIVEAEHLRTIGLDLVDRVRLQTPGQMSFSGVLWDRILGVGIGSESRAAKLRFLRYDDVSGEMQGFAVYSIREEEPPAQAILELSYLVTATDDAYAGLWRHLLAMDLIGEIRASDRSIDEPLRWQIADYRSAVKSLERDHLWTRILDVPAALTARRYHAPGHLVFDVRDDLGFATGRFLLTISSDGTAVVGTLTGDIPDDADAVALTVNELSAIYLGGVSPVLLTRAGRIEELTPGAAAVVELCFRSATTPWLSIWF